MVFLMAEVIDLSSLRKRAGLTQEQVAREMNLAGSTVRNWESGRNVPTLTPGQTRQLLELYKCSIAELEEASISSQSKREQAQSD